MAGLIPLWTDKDVREVTDAAEKEHQRRAIAAMGYIGEKFQTAARRAGTFTDRTKALRNSESYYVLLDGKVIVGGKVKLAAAKTANAELLAELKPQFNKGVVLICMAGMGYAAAVEAKGYDVITGSTPTDQKIGDFLRQACKQL